MADQQKGLGERVGNEAHDAVDSGNPVKIGGHATADVRADVGEDDRVDLSCDLKGALRITNEKEFSLHVQGDVAAAEVDSGRPIKIGGKASILLQAQATPGQRQNVAVSRHGAVQIAGSDGTNIVNLGVDANGNATIVGDVAHDAPDAGNPVSVGFNAAEFDADPPQVSADNDRVRAIATAQGIQWTLGGHPNIIRREWMTTAAQTDDPIIDAIAAGSHIVITAITVVASAAGSTTPQFRIGFGTANVPAEPASGASVVGIVASHGGVAAGSGIVEGNGSGVIAVGGDGEELRITNAVPTGGKITVIVSYYISTL